MRYPAEKLKTLSLLVTLAMTFVVLLACGPADESVQRELGNLPSVDISNPEPLPAPTGVGAAPQDEPTDPTVSDFRDKCHITGFNMFEHPTSDLEDNVWCYKRQLDEYAGWLASLPASPSVANVQQAWLDVQQVVNRDPDVVEGHAKVLGCLKELGFGSVNAGLLFPWQDFVSAQAYEARMRGYSASEREQQVALYVPSDQCAMGDSAYYYAQSVAWRAEVKRLQSKDPLKIKPMVDAELVSVLDMLGPNIYEHAIPHYLTLGGGEIFRDGGGVNPNPLPTAFPSQSAADGTSARTSNEARDMPRAVPHPDGLDGCRAYNRFGGRLEINYFHWCTKQLFDSVVSCRGTGDEDAELSCADGHLTGWKDYAAHLSHRCLALSNTASRTSCIESTNISEKHTALGRAYGAVLDVVATNDAVRDAYTKVVKCLADRSFENVEGRLLFLWQKGHQYSGDGDASAQWLADFTEAERELIQRLREPSDACATEHGLYAAQDTAWLAEVNRLQGAGSASAQPFVDWGILSILEEEGVAPFLTLQR